MHRVNVERLQEIRKLLNDMEESGDLESMRIPAELFYDLEHAGIIDVDQENWSYAPRYAITQKKKADKFSHMKGILRTFFHKKADKSNYLDYMQCYETLGMLNDLTQDPEWDHVRNCKVCEAPMEFKQIKVKTQLTEYWCDRLFCVDPECIASRDYTERRMPK